MPGLPNFSTSQFPISPLICLWRTKLSPKVSNGVKGLKGQLSDRHSLRRFIAVLIFAATAGSMMQPATARFPVADAGKWGFIDRTGNIAIRAQFDLVSGFSEGLAGVRIEKRCGYIGESGDVVIPPQFAVCSGFHEGLAVVSRQSTAAGEFRAKARKSTLFIPPGRRVSRAEKFRAPGAAGKWGNRGSWPPSRPTVVLGSPIPHKRSIEKEQHCSRAE